MFKISELFHFSSKVQKTNIISEVAVYAAKQYDRTYFDSVVSKLPSHQKLNLSYFDENLSNKSVILSQNCDTVCIFVNDHADAQVLKKLNSNGVNTIALRCSGFNNIDLAAAQALQMKVVRVPAYSPNSVAEHTMALLLTLNRKTHKAYNRTRDQNFALDGLLGFNLFEKTVGILGTGKIGQCFASICKGFGMSILCYDINRAPIMEELYGAKYVELEQLFKESEVISLHCPLTPQTQHIINNKTLSLMKKNAIILNTGRGGLIETKSVIGALKQGKIGGLGIDVYEQEEALFFRDESTHIMTDDILARLLSFNNVIVTGHQAFFTHEALSNICETTINNIIDIKIRGTSLNEVKI